MLKNEILKKQTKYKTLMCKKLNFIKCKLVKYTQLNQVFTS